MLVAGGGGVHDVVGEHAGQRGDVRVTFMMEQHLGHRTFYENLRRGVEAQDGGVAARWVEIAYSTSDGRWQRLPLVGERAAGALRGRGEALRGRARDDDVRFFNTQVPAVLGGSRVRDKPYVLCTDVTPVQYDQMAEGYAHVPDREGPVAWMKHWLNRRVFRGAAANVAWSSWARDSIVADYGVDPARAVTIPPGVDTGTWTPGDRRSDGRMTVLFVGGDLLRKGGATLLSAVDALPEKHVHTVLVTRTPHATSDHITVRNDLRPNSRELIDLYRSSDVFVLPSAAETFGIAAVEAAATGLPIIASRVGGLPDIVEDGKTGFLIPPGDVEALRHHLLMMAEDPDRRRKMGMAGRARAERHFDSVTNADRVLAVLRGAVREQTEDGPGGSRAGSRSHR